MLLIKENGPIIITKMKLKKLIQVENAYMFVLHLVLAL